MDQPIGLFDSGFGGLTVMREVIELLPKENLIYLGDTARLPYGNKSPEAVVQFAIENAHFLIQKEIKLLLIPCHTACSHALDTLQKKLPVPIIGVIQPGLDLVKGFSKIAVLGTTSTIEAGVYQSQIRKQNPQAEVFAKACPLFVPLVEEGLHDHKLAHLIAEMYLAPLKNKIDAALLACTHYPLLRSVLQEILGPGVELIEPARACALQARHFLEREGLLNLKNQTPRYEFYASDDPEKFRQLGQIFLGKEIETVEKNRKF